MAENRYEAVQDTVPSNLPQVYYVDSNRALYEEESVNMKDFFIGALVGGIVGAATGLLLAPKAGRELRGDVATQAVNLKDKTAELSATAKEKTSKISSTTAEKTSQLTQQLKAQSTNIVDKVKAKTAKNPKILDDGTVSLEGEESLDTTLADLTADLEKVADNMPQEAFQQGEDISEASKPSSI